MRILNSEQLLRCKNQRGRENMLKILEAGLEAADPYYSTKELFRVEGNTLYIGNLDYEARNDPDSGIEKVDLNETDKILVVGAAKGIQRIARAIEDVLGDRLTGGHVIGKYGDSTDLNKIGITLAAHPTPDENCVKGCHEIKNWQKILQAAIWLLLLSETVVLPF